MACAGGAGQQLQISATPLIWGASISGAGSADQTNLAEIFETVEEVDRILTGSGHEKSPPRPGTNPGPDGLMV